MVQKGHLCPFRKRPHKEENMEEIKQNWKKKISWLIIALIVVAFYKVLDNFSGIREWFKTFLIILKPFLIGLLISYILYIPCRGIERFYKKSKIKFISKSARGLSVVTTYIIAAILIVIIINCILPVLKDSIVELFSNLQNYYEILVQRFDELPEDSIFKSDIIRDKVNELQNTDMDQFLSLNNEKIVEYAKNVINIFTGVFDVFVSIVVSVYILLQRSILLNSLRRLAKAIFNKTTYEAVDRYFMKANKVFFSFISSQLVDAIIVGILTTIAMMILKVRYAPLLGFTIGLFNMIPYIGAIVAVIISIIITFITGGFGKALAMAIVVIVLQQIDANIINPKIIGSSLKTSPLLVIFSITIGGAYFGIVGMFLAVPIAVVLKTVLNDYIDYKISIKENSDI